MDRWRAVWGKGMMVSRVYLVGRGLEESRWRNGEGSMMGRERTF